MPETKLLRILLVDDDEDDVILFKSIIKKIPEDGFTVDWVENYDQAYEQISKDQHDVYVIDYRLGAESGAQLLRDFDVATRRQPFIMLTGAADGQLEKEAMRLGAADYLVKGSFDDQLLSRVLRYSIQRKVMEAQRIEHLLEVNRSKDEFIAVASHELRTPATAVKQYMGMVIQGFAGDLNDNQKQFLDQAYESNERQLRIIDDILRVARLDLDKLSLNKSKVDIAAIAHGVASDIKPLTKKRKQNLTFIAPKSPLWVKGDELYLRMALANIVDNASKYSHEDGEIKIELTQSQNEIQIEISDSGVGISEDDLDKLFVKFSRIHNPLSIERGGTGLGLYWSREIMQIHHGDISVSSAIDKGTTFTISLPALKAIKSRS